MVSSSLNAPLHHDSTLHTGCEIALSPLHAQALAAREIRVKEAFTIVGRGDEYFRASLTSMNRNGGTALVYEKMLGTTESPARITLLCAVLARQRMMVVMQKATELGVERIVPVLSERSVQRQGLDHEKASAWPKQVLRAARQCRRASLPDVREAIPLGDILDDVCFTEAERRVYLDDVTTSDAKLDAIPVSERGPQSMVFAVGPEGGWTDGERQLLVERGATPLRLGGRVLRAETAVLVGLTLLQHSYGDM